MWRQNVAGKVTVDFVHHPLFTSLPVFQQRLETTKRHLVTTKPKQESPRNTCIFNNFNIYAKYDNLITFHWTVTQGHLMPPHKNLYNGLACPVDYSTFTRKWICPHACESTLTLQ